jgi:hypothetical protein
MRFAYTLKQKTKIATLLFFVMACSILIRVLEDKSVKSMNKSFMSMYNDRLVPVTDLYYISEHMYAKQDLFERLLCSGAPVNLTAVSERIDRRNTAVGSLISKYEKTQLVDQEKKSLDLFKDRWLKSTAIEKNILQMIADNAVDNGRQLYETTGRQAVQSSIRKLSELIKIQTKIGQELIHDSEFMVSGSKIYSALQLALAILIGITIVAIISASNVIKLNNDKFNLN